MRGWVDTLVKSDQKVEKPIASSSDEMKRLKLALDVIFKANVQESNQLI